MFIDLLSFFSDNHGIKMLPNVGGGRFKSKETNNKFVSIKNI